MLKELIAQMFCREIRRKLRRLGMLGALVGAYFALHVELPLEVSIATKEAEIAMADIRHSMDQTLTIWRRHILDSQSCHSKSRKEC
jgi:hypothetical protein